MEKLFAVLLLSALVGNTLEDDITAIRTEVVSSEGQSVTVSCKYSVKAQNLQWYRQDPGSAPQYLLLITDTKEPEVIQAKPPNPRLTAKLNQERNQVDLQISSAAVSDSAVYYCALQNTQKIIFGSGTRFTTELNEEYEPSFYKVTDNEGTEACLATGFSRHNATKKHPSISGIFEKQPAVRISDDSLYNQVAILSSVNDTCVPDGMEKGECTDGLTPDPKVNLVTMTILGLRLLFIKTVVFNVLITLRLWISQ